MPEICRFVVDETFSSVVWKGFPILVARLFVAEQVEAS